MHRDVRGPLRIVDVRSLNRKKINLQNRFHALTNTGTDDQTLDSGLDWKTCHDEVGHESSFSDQFMKLTVDSGAGENVMEGQLSTRTLFFFANFRTSRTHGVLFTTASGDYRVEP